MCSSKSISTSWCGDAAATGHFSIGSGSRLAFDSAIALAEYLHSEPTLEGAVRVGRPLVQVADHVEGASLAHATRVLARLGEVARLLVEAWAVVMGVVGVVDVAEEGLQEVPLARVAPIEHEVVPVRQHLSLIHI